MLNRRFWLLIAGVLALAALGFFAARVNRSVTLLESRIVLRDMLVSGETARGTRPKH